MSDRIEYRGHFHTEDELRESIWLANIELRAGLPKREHIEAQQHIAEMELSLQQLLIAEAAGR
jgi:hypothetical protein